MIGILALIITLVVFSIFTMKFPKGSKAMTGLANAAVASFFVEAVFKYILGDFANIEFFYQLGTTCGELSGLASAILVGLYLKTNPVYALIIGLTCSPYGILTGFIVGYLSHFILEKLEKHIPESIAIIFISLIAAIIGSYFGSLIDPLVNNLISTVGVAISQTTNSSPIIMGFILGGLMKVTCTSPLSAMALTAMLQLKGLPMGIAAVACVGGAFADGIVLYYLKLGNKSNIIGIMLEPLTQANIVTKNPIPIYTSDFIAGGLSGIVAASLGIINNAPGTSAPIPGLLAPFAFNDPLIVLLAIFFSAILGTISGILVSKIYIKIKKQDVIRN